MEPQSKDLWTQRYRPNRRPGGPTPGQPSCSKLVCYMSFFQRVCSAKVRGRKKHVLVNLLGPQICLERFWSFGAVRSLVGRPRGPELTSMEPQSKDLWTQKYHPN